MASRTVYRERGRARASRESVAYDYAALRGERPGQKARDESARLSELLPREKGAKRVSVLPTALLFMAVMVVLCSVVYNYMTVTQLTAESARMKAELIELEDTARTLKAQQEIQLDLKFVESYAEDKLGMKKLDRSQIEYVYLASPDHVQMGAGKEEKESYFLSGFIKGFDMVVEYLR